MSSKSSDVIIIGGGVSGAALMFTLARYTDIQSITLLEKYSDIALLNSNPRANSQTLHVGDIETNYSLEKARRVSKLSNMIAHYGKLFDEGQSLLTAYQKMILAVGEEEVAYIAHRHEEFSDAFPYMELWDKNKIRSVEPDVVLIDGKDRNEPILASGCQGKVSAVDFGRLAASFVNQAMLTKPQARAYFNVRANSIVDRNGEFEVHTNQGVFHSRFVAVCAGAHSLLLAHGMGHGLEYAQLPVAGSFFYIPRQFRGKVYTIQNPKLPFAAIHADPDLIKSGVTRLGPTALILPKLERYHSGTYLEFFKVLKLDKAVIKVFTDLMSDSEIRNYILRNILFDIPLVREKMFVKDARKIIPSLRTSELKFAKAIGGVRPQIINRNQQKLVLGEATINPGNGVLFNVTPSPGASTCLGMAYQNAEEISQYLGNQFNKDQITTELLDNEEY